MAKAPEFWKCICRADSSDCVWAVALCNRVWNHADVPSAWHKALICTIFKKGDASNCENYKPIPLLAVGYKLFATILLRRLINGGAEARIWLTEFGFRSGRITADAVFVARRLLDHVLYHKDDQQVFLALDWSKAFYSVDPERLCHALIRFGIPQKLCDVIGAVYKDRQLSVRDSRYISSIHRQHFGISQRCPLSPFCSQF